jgi:hypothetical protein
MRLGGHHHPVGVDRRAVRDGDSPAATTSFDAPDALLELDAVRRQPRG